MSPRLGTVEQWNYENLADDHPIHVHVNPMEIQYVFDANDPISGSYLPTNYALDTANIPAGRALANGTIIAGLLGFRMNFTDYLGAYVWHCHRLLHEDTGLMVIVNVIPAVRVYAIAVEGSGTSDSKVHIYNEHNNQLIATVIPFPDFKGQLSIAVNDVDGDMIHDLVVGQYTKGFEPRIKAYSGKSNFHQLIANFLAFKKSFRGGVRVAAADVDGNGLAADFVIASGGPSPIITVFNNLKAGSYLYPTAIGTAPLIYASFSPTLTPCDTTASTKGLEITSLSRGLLNVKGGRFSIIVGMQSLIRVYTFTSEYSNILDAKYIGKLSVNNHPVYCPKLVASFYPYGKAYTGGISVTAGYTQAIFGGAEALVVSQLSSTHGEFSMFSSGDLLNGWPPLYGEDPSEDEYFYQTSFKKVYSMSTATTSNVESTKKSVYVATSSNPYGADIFVSSMTKSSFDLLRGDENDKSRKSRCQVTRYAVAPGNTTIKTLISGGHDFTSLRVLKLGVVYESECSNAYALGGL